MNPTPKRLNGKQVDENGKRIDDMNDEEFTNYITELINGKGLKKYTYRELKDDDGNIVTITSFKSDIGWEITKEDIWND